jgi:hypothetical protein
VACGASPACDRHRWAGREHAGQGGRRHRRPSAGRGMTSPWPSRLFRDYAAVDAPSGPAPCQATASRS